MPPYPPLTSAFSSSTSTLTPYSLPSFTAEAAKSTGFRSEGGVFTQSRTWATASAVTSARSRAALASLFRARSVSTVRLPGASVVPSADLYAVNV